MNSIRVLFVAVLCASILPLFAQQSERKGHVLRGKVEQINESTKSLTVNHEKVDDWMEAMTMTYAVDKEEVLKQVKVGDQITATVYDGDYKLYEVKVVPLDKKK